MKANLLHGIVAVGSDNFGQMRGIVDDDDGVAQVGDGHEMVSAAIVSARGTRDTFPKEDDDADGREHGQRSAEEDDGTAHRQLLADGTDVVHRVDDDLRR